jgi:transposase, IS5 family
VFGIILEVAMAHRSRGQERLGFAVSSQTASSLDDLSRLIDWGHVAGILGQVHASAKGELGWPPLSQRGLSVISCVGGHKG